MKRDSALGRNIKEEQGSLSRQKSHKDNQFRNAILEAFSTSGVSVARDTDRDGVAICFRDYFMMRIGKAERSRIGMREAPCALGCGGEASSMAIAKSNSVLAPGMVTEIGWSTVG